jgi:hypothetical protein
MVVATVMAGRRATTDDVVSRRGAAVPRRGINRCRSIPEEERGFNLVNRASGCKIVKRGTRVSHAMGIWPAASDAQTVQDYPSLSLSLSLSLSPVQSLYAFSLRASLPTRRALEQLCTQSCPQNELSRLEQRRVALRREEKP